MSDEYALFGASSEVSSADPSLSLPHQSHTVPLATTRPRFLYEPRCKAAEGTVSFLSQNGKRATPLPADISTSDSRQFTLIFSSPPPPSPYPNSQ